MRERVEVTGSNIRRTDTETASPIRIITRQDIERTGKQNIAEILQTVTGNNQGSLPTAFSAGFATGAAGVSLRGLGLNSTLVLLNGRRLAPYGLADDGSRNFVDLNTIPLEAVERIEILKDGASAIYGSDAVGGVVNVILRSEFQGASLGYDGGNSYHGDGTQGRAYGIYGLGDLDRDRTTSSRRSRRPSRNTSWRRPGATTWRRTTCAGSDISIADWVRSPPGAASSATAAGPAFPGTRRMVRSACPAAPSRNGST